MKTFVVFVLLFTVIAASVAAKESHRALHAEQKAVLVSNGRLKSRDGKTYIVVRKSS
jgi:deoxycytidylate deaminase